jgi:hypothetical protein
MKRFVSLAFVASALPAMSAVPGFVQEFASAGELGGFGGGATLSNPGTGGVGGAGDGYLVISRTTPANFASFCTAPEVTGNLLADGVTGFSVWLNDVGAHQNFEIHVAVGNGPTNFWVYNPAFFPLDNTWTRFDVDITDASLWTQITGTGTFQNAMQTADRIQIRHQIPPFTQNAGSIAGDLGVDRLTVNPVPEPSSLIALAPMLLLASRLRR